MASLDFKIIIDALRIPPEGGQSQAGELLKYQVTWNAGGSGDAEGRTPIVAAGSGPDVLLHYDGMFRTAAPPDRLLQLSVVQYRCLRPTPANAAADSNVGYSNRSLMRRSHSVGSVASQDGGDDAAVTKKVVGVLVIDLNAHVPKPGAIQSRQRATLAVSLCPFETPIMVRLAVESTKSHAVYQEEPSATRRESSVYGSSPGLVTGRGASREPRHVGAEGATPAGSEDIVLRSAAPSRLTTDDGTPFSPDPLLPSVKERHATEVGGLLLPHHDVLLNDGQMEMARMKAAVSTLTAANQQLRDENMLLRTAVQKAREEPSYTYGGGGSAKGSLRDGSDRGVQRVGHREDSAAKDQPDIVAVLQAEIAVLQRGLQVAKDRLREKEDAERELHAEVESLTMANRFQAEDITRLEAELQAAKSDRRASAQVEDLERSVAELQARNRLLHSDLRSEEAVRAKLSEELQRLRDDYAIASRRRSEQETQVSVLRSSYEQSIGTLEGQLRTAQSELQNLHNRCQDSDKRCHAVAHIVESQASIITSKNQKIHTLQSLIEASDVLQRISKMGDKRGVIKPPINVDHAHSGSSNTAVV